MNNKKLVPNLREKDDFQTIKKTENEDIISLINLKATQSSTFRKNSQENQQLWKDFYKKELNKNKKRNPQASHNELTSQISQKWKRKKLNKKIVNKLKQKIKQENNNIDVTMQSTNIEQIAINNESQKLEIVEKLKQITFKIIYFDNICELKGDTILEALNNSVDIIYINKLNDVDQQELQDLKYSNIIQDNKSQKCYECQEDQEIQQQSLNNSQNECVNDEDESNFQIVNKIMNYL